MTGNQGRQGLVTRQQPLVVPREGRQDGHFFLRPVIDGFTEVEQLFLMVDIEIARQPFTSLTVSRLASESGQAESCMEVKPRRIVNP